MRTVREELLCNCGGWGWEVWAGESVWQAIRAQEEAVKVMERASPVGNASSTSFGLQKAAEGRVLWVWALMYLLEGMRA